MLASEVLSVGIAVLCINLWEEAAWAGFFQTRLERDHNVFVAAVLTAVPFSAVHLPLRVIAGEATTWGGLAFAFLGLMIFVPIIRILFGCVLRGARDSVRLTTTALTVVVLLALRRHLARRRRAASDAGDHSGWTEAGAVDVEDRP
ncbi:MAG TPA: CPBP family intramembrane glutamic endopeptidase [Propionibacteriaceae bacterium]